ncbi:4522_t:CDS:2 [Ambispora leptoticha]|uniref:4522_t:CDS:1 n=1 Tax=Ambispora leptoticha TaxID=144679 RepID=A0A9N9AH52_9GLOM|nr:4522_t:CDS:2 [Ambispora leptoticha]
MTNLGVRKVARCVIKVSKEPRGTRFPVDPRANDVGFSHISEGSNVAAIGSPIERLGNPTTSFSFTPTRHQNTKAIIPNKKYSPTRTSTSILKSSFQSSRKTASSSSFNYAKNGMNNERDGSCRKLHENGTHANKNNNDREIDSESDSKNGNLKSTNNSWTLHKNKQKESEKKTLNQKINGSCKSTRISKGKMPEKSSTNDVIIRMLESEARNKNIISDKDNHNCRKKSKRKKIPDPIDEDNARNLAAMRNMMKTYGEKLSQIGEAIIQLKADQEENRSQPRIINCIHRDDMENSVEEYSDASRRETNHQENNGSSITMKEKDMDHDSQQRLATRDNLAIRDNRYHPYNQAKKIHMLEQTLQRTSLKVIMSETRISRLEVHYAKLSKQYNSLNKVLKEAANSPDTKEKAFFADAIQNIRENYISMCVGFSLGTAGIFVASQVWLFYFL